MATNLPNSGIRRYERVEAFGDAAPLLVLANGEVFGRVRSLSLGGMLVHTSRRLELHSEWPVHVVAEEMQANFPVTVRVIYHAPQAAGLTIHDASARSQSELARVIRELQLRKSLK